MKKTMSIRRGTVRTLSLGGGPTDVAKGALSGWRMCFVDPEVTAEFFNTLDPRNIKLVREAHCNMVLVHFCSGFPLEKERFVKPLLWKFRQACRRNRVFVDAYLSMTNMFAVSMFRDVPESRKWVQTDMKGNPIPYGAAVYQGTPTRYLACINHPGWRAYQRRKIDFILEFRPDMLMLDNSGAGCYCDYCREKFRRYTGDVLGRAGELRSFAATGFYRPGESEDLETGGDRSALILEDFRLKNIREFARELKAYARGKQPEILLHHNVHHAPFGADNSDFDASEDTREPGIVKKDDYPGYVQRTTGLKSYAIEEQERVITNSGLLEFMLADGKLKRSISSCPHAGVRGLKPISLAEEFSRPVSLPPRSLKLAIAENLAHSGSYFLSWVEFIHRRLEPTNWKIICRWNGFMEAHEGLFADSLPVSPIGIMVDRNIRNRLQFLDLFACRNLMYDLLVDYKTGEGDLDKYRLLVMPGIRFVSDDLIRVITAYVKRGGNLIATGSSSLGRDETYDARSDYGLRRLFGISAYERAKSRKVERVFGEGRVVFFPRPVEETAEKKSSVAREFFAEVARLGGAPVFTVNNARVIGHLMRWKKGLALHLLNYAPEPQKNVTVKLSPDLVVRPGSIFALSPDRRGAIKLRYDGDKKELHVAGLDIYEMIVMSEVR